MILMQCISKNMVGCQIEPVLRMTLSPSSNIAWQNPFELAARFVLGQETSPAEVLFTGKAGKTKRMNPRAE
jgi:hypothetical protein